MQEKSIPAAAHDQGRRLSPAEEDAQVEHAILGLLLVSPQVPGLWSADEIAREIGNPVATADALARLDGAGLIHRCEGFVFPSRAAARFDEIEL
jgi:hypothetical protein